MTLTQQERLAILKLALSNTEQEVPSVRTAATAKSLEDKGIAEVVVGGQLMLYARLRLAGWARERLAEVPDSELRGRSRDEYGPRSSSGVGALPAPAPLPLRQAWERRVP